MARFFIDRPVFAWVIAIIIMLAGAIAITRLPIARYPTIAPPTIVVSANYPGASARSVEDSVTQVIEQNMKGLDGMIYLASTSESNGQARRSPSPSKAAPTPTSRRCRCRTSCSSRRRCCRRSCSSRASARPRPTPDS